MGTIANVNVDGVAYKMGMSIVTLGSGSFLAGYFADEACTKQITDVNTLLGAMEESTVYKKMFDPSTITWASASDADIALMLSAAYSGALNLSSYWSVGDLRTVSISSMSATGVGESHAAQSVQVAIMDLSPSYKTEDGKDTKLLWGLKDCLKETGYMNSSDTNSGGWESCARKAWCDNVFLPAMPSLFRDNTKTVGVVTANGSSTTTATSKNKCFLLAEKEIFGGTSYANSTAESGLKQVPYYATSSNRVKKLGATGGADLWWERSPSSGDSNRFCSVDSGGSANSYGASLSGGLAPCGCF